MTQACVLLLVTVFVISAVQAQFGAVDQEWLMDDPHKADRLPIWSQLLGNRAFPFGAQATTNRFPVYTTNNSNNLSGKTGNSWMKTLQNLYRIVLWRQLLGNQNIGARVTAARATTPTPPRAINSNTSGRTTGQNWTDQLRNFYRIAVWNRLLSNQSGSSQNAK
ncbi:uncharacterized protein LOC123527384 [Mercenaria mercenaria]|uniref:uncharacterized protein LOC123527384 n=1 Tax=Mercenaria mercenaria TaxID=6596 RepID=UPI00234EE4E6|nr:uncharacterized protein LOC123527384 [Mercenaria mercenaria]XP_045162724.2 uncharacterized protein LOC123527384 [Mercenaria mercenaria]